MLYHHQTIKATLEGLNVKAEAGLSDASVQTLREKHGLNKLREKKKKTMLQRFLDQFKDVMILILIAAAIVSLSFMGFRGLVDGIFG